MDGSIGINCADGNLGIVFSAVNFNPNNFMPTLSVIYFVFQGTKTFKVKKRLYKLIRVQIFVVKL